MSSYDFIIDTIKFSYSSLSTFNCPYAFKLTYIDGMPRANNFYAEYGTLIHQCMELFFSEKLYSFELADYYMANFDNEVKTPPPSPPYGLYEKYKQQGYEFFKNFNFPIYDYDVLLVEGKLDFEVKGDTLISLTSRPDLVLKNKRTGVVSLYDYKTSTPFWVDKKTGIEVLDEQKLAGYYKQMYIYTFAIRNNLKISIDEISLWFPRANRIITIPWNSKEEEETMNWVYETIEKIKKEEVFAYNNKETYFCNNLCSVRMFCEYR